MHHVAVCGSVNFFTAFAVQYISEAWVICILDTISLREYSFANEIEVLNMRWKPRNFFGAHQYNPILNRVVLKLGQ